MGRVEQAVDGWLNKSTPSNIQDGILRRAQCAAHAKSTPEDILTRCTRCCGKIYVPGKKIQGALRASTSGIDIC